MKLIECDRCRKTAALELDVATAKHAGDVKPPKGWTRPSLNYRERDLCPECSGVLKLVFEQFLANGVLPIPAKPR